MVAVVFPGRTGVAEQGGRAGRPRGGEPRRVAGGEWTGATGSDRGKWKGREAEGVFYKTVIRKANGGGFKCKIYSPLKGAIG